MTEIYTSHRTDGIMIFTFTADRLDIFDVPEISHGIEKQIRDNGCPNIIFDLRQTDYIDSTGFGFIVSMHNLVMKQGHRAAMVCDEGPIMNAMEILNIRKIFSVHSGVEEAVAELGG